MRVRTVGDLVLERRGREAGFTLLEVMVVALVCLPILLGVLRTSGTVADTVSASDTASHNAEKLSGIVERVAKQFRAGHRSTFETKALQIDVDEARASSVGEWIPCVELTPRTSLRFRSAAGTLSMNASAKTTTREYVLVPESGELANGADDDGDGLVDESSLVLYRGGIPLTIARGIERFQYEIDGRALTIEIRVAKRDRKRRIYRAFAKQTIFIRNP